MTDAALDIDSHVFDEHWERPSGPMKRRTRETESTSLEAIGEHVGACRRASVYLYGSGIISRGDHARIMTKLFRYERDLQRLYAAREAK